MGRIYIFTGKSASGKDTAAKGVLRELSGMLRPLVRYTTRPIREEETEGREYHFVTTKDLERLRTEGQVIECQTYQTVKGPWSYFTVKDEETDPDRWNYVTIGTLPVISNMRKFFRDDEIAPIYLYEEDGERLVRAVRREQAEDHPDYREVCRRFLADEEDYSEENRKKAGIEVSFENREISETIQEVSDWIRADIQKHEGNAKKAEEQGSVLWQ